MAGLCSTRLLRLLVGLVCLMFPVSLAAERLTTVLIFPVRVAGITLSDSQNEEVRNYLGTRLTVEGVYKVMPESQVREDLIAAKVESYQECYDDACRIDLSKAVAADKSLSVNIVNEVEKCRITALLYDIAQEVTETAADVKSECSFVALKESMVAVAAQLSGKKAPAVPQQAIKSSAGVSQFVPTSLPDVPSVTPVGELQSTGAAAGTMTETDVDAYEAYDKAAQTDASAKASPQEKLKAWENAAKYPAFSEQANARSAQWRDYISEKARADENKKQRIDAMENDWKKVSRLFGMKIFDATQKKEWAKVFLDAWGGRSNPHFGEAAVYLGSDGKDGIEWISLPGGTFLMGNNEGMYDEKPVHEVTVSAFRMAKSEVTMDQYRRCVNAGVCPENLYGKEWEAGRAKAEEYFKRCLEARICKEKQRAEVVQDMPCEKCPRQHVPWQDARLYCKWVGGRLPTEAEWEYAAKSGGGKQLYPWGDSLPTSKEAQLGGVPCKKSGPCPLPVCSLPSGNTEQGICDMIGNLWEWVEDGYGSYNNASATDPVQASVRDGYIVARGGGFDYSSAAGGKNDFGRRQISIWNTTNRAYFPINWSLDFIGFRCVISEIR